MLTYCNSYFLAFSVEELSLAHIVMYSLCRGKEEGLDEEDINDSLSDSNEQDAEKENTDT